MLPPIIPGLEKSRPPVYKPELVALLTSSEARSKGRSQKRDQVQTPTALPKRADPSSEEARLLGPFSKRREVNIRWRWFRTETGKLHPPLDVSRHDSEACATSQVCITESEGKGSTQRITRLGFFWEVMHDVESIGPSRLRPATRHERIKMSSSENRKSDADSLPRFVRRRYAQLLKKMPRLAIIAGGKSRYEVTLSDRIQTVPLMDDSTAAWIKRADSIRILKP